MKKMAIPLLLLTALLMNACNQGTHRVDLIIHNALIYTADDAFPTASAMAVKDGIVVATGTAEELLEKFSTKESLDLRGKTVYPGFIDPHCHFYGFGMGLTDANLVGASSVGELIEILRAHQEAYPAEWLTGRGWDQNLWPEKVFPHRKQLDAAFADVPVLLTRVDGHAAVANTEALKRAGIVGPMEVPGGQVITENGQPTGILIDNAIGLVRQLIPPPNREEQIAALRMAQKKLFAVGLTGVGDAGLDKDVILLIDSMQQAGDLHMRVYAMISPTKENINAFMQQGIIKNDYLHVGSVKLFADGALGSRGAMLLEPYADDPSQSGLLVETPEYLEEMAAKALKYGFQVNTHCIGDSAVRLMLDIYSRLLEPGNDRRWRIEHAQTVHPDDMHRFGQYGVVPSIQAIHATSDMLWAVHRLGPERIRTAYAYRELLEQNGWLSNGSDFPVEPIDPLLGFYAATVRKDLQGRPQGGFQMENALTREQALKAMTIWAAKAQFEEHEKGSLEAGKLADFVVLDRDILQVPPDEILQTHVVYTFSGGKAVYRQSTK